MNKTMAPLGERQRAKLSARFEAGESIEDLAKWAGCSPNTMRKAVHGEGLSAGLRALIESKLSAKGKVVPC